MQVAVTSTSADTGVYPLLLNNMFGAKLKLVTGYQGGADMTLALERGEVDGVCGLSYSTLKTMRPDWFRDRKLNIILQIGLQKDKALPDVPLIMDLTSDALKKAALRLIVSRQSIARPFAAPPGIPAERARLLRAAFDATMKDPEFRAEAAKLNLDVEPVSGAEVEALLQEAYASPAEVVKLATELVREGP